MEPDDPTTSLAAEVVALLREQGATLATAESLTGGRLAAAVTSVPGASAAYVGGVVSYATEVKTAVLGVPAEVVEEHGVVSAPCALAMARGVAGLMSSTWSVSTTGVAGPDRQEGHPPGTVHAAVHGPGGHRLLALHLPGDRPQVQDATCREVLSALRAMLDASGEVPGEEPVLR